MKVEERVLPAATFKPEVASLNMGSINFGLYHLVDKYKTFKFDWEKPHLEATRDLVFRNSFKDIEFILKTCYDNGTRFEFECYDIAHLYNLAHFADRGLVKPPFFVQSVFGLLGGIGSHPEDVAHMKRTADRLFGDKFRWSVLGAGAAQLRIAAQAAALGGNIRVGLEDSLWAGRGKLATSNAEQVALARKIIEGLGMEVATPDEARAILELKGADKVSFSQCPGRRPAVGCRGAAALLDRFLWTGRLLLRRQWQGPQELGIARAHRLAGIAREGRRHPVTAQRLPRIGFQDRRSRAHRCNPARRTHPAHE